MREKPCRSLHLLRAERGQRPEEAIRLAIPPCNRIGAARSLEHVRDRPQTMGPRHGVLLCLRLRRRRQADRAMAGARNATATARIPRHSFTAHSVGSRCVSRIRFITSVPIIQVPRCVEESLQRLRQSDRREIVLCWSQGSDRRETLLETQPMTTHWGDKDV